MIPVPTYRLMISSNADAPAAIAPIQLMALKPTLSASQPPNTLPTNEPMALAPSTQPLACPAGMVAKIMFQASLFSDDENGFAKKAFTNARISFQNRTNKDRTVPI